MFIIGLESNRQMREHHSPVIWATGKKRKPRLRLVTSAKLPDMIYRISSTEYDNKCDWKTSKIVITMITPGLKETCWDYNGMTYTIGV